MIKLSAVLLFSFVYSWSPTQVTGSSCQVVCRYTTWARDAECTNRGLTTIPAPCKPARVVDISFNSLRSVPVSSFRGYWQLEYLHLENNQITSISPGAFDNLRRTLRQVNISSNDLTEIQENTFVNMTLRYLLLTDNRISIIRPGAFKGMGRLLKIYLGDNHLTSLEYTIFDHMPNLREINLRNNRIVSLDVSFIATLPFFQKIFVQNNSISELTGDVDVEQTALLLINLSHNRLASFDCSVMTNLLSLSELYLTDNSLQAVGGCGRRQMEALKLGGNPLHCDCGLSHLFTFLQENPDVPSPNCSSPASARGFTVRNAPLESCQGDSLSSTVSTTFHPRQKSPVTPNRQTMPLRTSSNPVVALASSVSTVSQPGLDFHTVNKVPESDSFMDRNSVTRSSLVKGSVPGGPFSMTFPLYVILVAIAILIFAIIILLICCLRCYCIQTGNDEGDKKYYPAECTMYPQSTVVEDAQDASVHLTCNHNYEIIGERCAQRPTPPRHPSVGSENSSTAMLPATGSYPSGGGLWNSGLSGNHRCICECHEEMSEESGSWEGCRGSSCTDTSYEMDNHFNEVSESTPFSSNCCQVVDGWTMSRDETLSDWQRHGRGREGRFCTSHPTGEPNGPPPSYEGSIQQASPPPPLPPKCVDNDPYIKHSQMHGRQEIGVLT